MSTGDIAYTGDDHSNGVPIHNLERISVERTCYSSLCPYSSSGVVNSFNKLMTSGENETSLTLGYRPADENSARCLLEGDFAFSLL